MSIPSQVVALIIGLWVAPLALAQRVPDERLDLGGPPGATKSSQVSLVSRDDNVYVVWIEELESGHRVAFNFSGDHGRTWLEPALRIDRSPGSELRSPVIATQRHATWIAWQDDRDGAWDIYLQRTLNATFPLPDVRMDVGDVPGSADSIDPVVVARDMAAAARMQLAVAGRHAAVPQLRPKDPRDAARLVEGRVARANGYGLVVHLSDLRADLVRCSAEHRHYHSKGSVPLSALGFCLAWALTPGSC